MSLTLRSQNSKFSYLIKKNPNNPRLDKLRQGISIGYYTHTLDSVLEQEYNIYFCETFNNISYCETLDNTDSNYCNKMKFMSPLLILDLLNLHFVDNLKKVLDEDLEAEQELIITLIYIKSNALNFIKSIIESINNSLNIKITIIDKSYNIYSIHVKTLGTLNYLLNIIQSLLCFIIIKNNFKPQISIESITARLNKSLNYIINNLSYVHIYKLLTLFDKSWFDSLLPLFIKPNIKYNHLKLAELRFHRVLNDIKKINTIKSINNIIDIGSGPGYYLNLLKKLDKITLDSIEKYYCYDIDKSCLDKIESKKNEYPKKIIVSLDKPKKVDGSNIILLMEVIEHMDYNDSINLLNYILDLEFVAILLSTPNSDFNINYNLTTYRHDDHKYELKEQEFKDFINSIVKDRYNVYFNNIGDSIDNVQPTNYCIISKIKLE